MCVMYVMYVYMTDWEQVVAWSDDVSTQHIGELYHTYGHFFKMYLASLYLSFSVALFLCQCSSKNKCFCAFIYEGLLGLLECLLLDEVTYMYICIRYTRYVNNFDHASGNKSDSPK